MGPRTFVALLVVAIVVAIAVIAIESGFYEESSMKQYLENSGASPTPTRWKRKTFP
jgi:hypothetical protein